MRKPATLTLGLALAACGSPAAPSEPASSAVPPPSATAPAASATAPAAPELPRWSAPSIVRTADRVSHTQRLVARIDDPAAAGARVEARVALGPTPPGCHDPTYEGESLTRAEDGSVSVDDLDPAESVTICVRDAEGHVRAEASSRGFRSAPIGYAAWERGHVHVRMSAGELDDDVRAVVLVSVRESAAAPSPVECVLEAVATEGDDAPEHCSYPCGEHVVLEIPRARWDALADAPLATGRAIPDDADSLYPAPLGWSLPVEVPEGDDSIVVCVRTESGALVTDTPSRHAIATEPWQGCDLDSVAGCLSIDGSDEHEGDTALGLAPDGTLVRATVRTLDARTEPTVLVRTTRGAFTAPLRARVRTAGGEERALEELAVGTTLWSRWGEAIVRSVERSDYDIETVSVDLSGAAWALVGGFALRDLGPGGEGGAPAFTDDGFATDYGDGDCAAAIEWPAAATTGSLSLRLAQLDGVDHHDVAAVASPSILTTDVDAATLAAVAALAPGARIRLQLAGEPVQCDTSYRVWRCDGAAAPVGPAITVRTTPYCIAAGTPVDTPRGPRAIERLHQGEEVWAADAAGRIVTARVIGSVSHRDRELLSVSLEDGTLLRATPDHVVMVGPQRTPRVVRDLRVGDVLTRLVRGTLVRTGVIAIAPAERGEVIELRVTAPDTYFASGVLVHNY